MQSIIAPASSIALQSTKAKEQEKRLFCIKTLGCKVNQYEAQVMRENFLRRGYVEARGFDEADVCVINTCTVTSTSDTKSLRLIRSAVKKEKCVVATGCLVEEDLDLSRLRRVRFIVRNKDKYDIPQIIEKTQRHKDTKTPRTIRFAQVRGKPLDSARGRQDITTFKDHTRVFVKVQDGCNNVCSYCKVRIVRGRSRSRLLKDILRECKTLIENGSREIVLTGICLGAYGRDIPGDLKLAGLIKEICKIHGSWRLRLSSIEPKDLDEDLVREIQFQDKVCKHIHMPFQSGDDYILAKMSRPYKRDDYLRIVDRLKNAISDIAISTDIMVGFPGETDKRFQNTEDFIKAVGPMRMHVFPFSRRRGTKAYGYKEGVSDVVKKQREEKMSCLGKELAMEFIDKFIDTQVEVLVETKGSEHPYLQGYTDRYIKVYINGPDSLKGRLVNCRLTLTNQKVCGILSPSSIFPRSNICLK